LHPLDTVESIINIMNENPLNQLKGQQGPPYNPEMSASSRKRAFCAYDPLNASMGHHIPTTSYNRNPEEPCQSKRSLTGEGLVEGGNKKRRASPDLESGSEGDAWTEEMHRLFVESIYAVGVKHASPAVIIENMTEENPALTAERVKSHLQKYRSNKEKSKADFFSEYESWMQKALTIGAAGGASSTGTSMIMEMIGSDTLLGGDVAASLAYSVMAEDQTALDGEKAAAQRTLAAPDMGRHKDITGARIAFPTLTEEERKSALGVSLSHVMGLFYSMTQHLIKEREATELEKPMPDTAEREAKPEPQVEKAPEVATTSVPSLSQNEPINFLEDEQDLSIGRTFHDLQPVPRGYNHPPFPPLQYDHIGMANHYEPAATTQQQYAHALAQQQQQQQHAQVQQQQHVHAQQQLQQQQQQLQQQQEAYQQQNAFAPPSASFHLSGQMPHPHPPNFDRRHGLYKEFMKMYPHNY
jgi:SHAQKYF class myb-like DNA-binding protein